MRKPKLIKYKRKEIIYLDFSDLKKKEAILDLEQLGGELIQSQKINTALTLTNMENMFFDNQIRAHFIRISRANAPYVKAGAVIGLYGLISFMYQGFLKATGRNIKLFKTRQEALDYLTSFS